jgi:DNA-binding transcriptional regulator YiaG
MAECGGRCGATQEQGNEMKELRPAKQRVEVSVGESLRILRELQELSQNQLAELTVIPQATISHRERSRESGRRARQGFRSCPSAPSHRTRVPRLGGSA